MSKYAIMLSQGSHIEKSKITKHSPVKLLEGNNSELFQKKLLKGKLIKLINQSIIRTSEPSENSTEQSLSLRNRVTKNSKKKFSINFNPNLIGNDIKFTTISHDNYVTPHELVSRNFSPNQIQLISSNPIYFKLPEDFMEIDLFKKRKLIDVLERESKNNLPVLKDNNQSNLHTKVMKNVKRMKNDKKGKVLPNIDISVQKKEEEKAIIKYPSCRRNKLNFSKDLSDSLFSSRKNNSNLSTSLMVTQEKMLKYNSNKNYLIEKTSKKFQQEIAKVDEHREKLFQTRLRQEEEDEMIFRYNDKITQNYIKKKKNCK